MQDADHVYQAICQLVENDMRSDQVPTVARPNIIGRPAKPWVCGNRLDRAPHGTQILVLLCKR
jgi:hypothetical protein